jgi:exopolysaccharide biosynthesis polyprenyl glycosylphosphotransferase
MHGRNVAGQGSRSCSARIKQVSTRIFVHFPMPTTTPESITPRHGEFLRPLPIAVARQSWPLYARLLAWPLLHKLVYVGGDLLAIILAHMVAYRIVDHFFHVPISSLNPFGYHRFYIPVFTVVLYFFDGYKSTELRRPEQELESSCKAVSIGFLGLVLFNFVILRSEPFSRYMLVSWFLLSCVCLLIVRFTLRAMHNRLWKGGLCRRRAVLAGSLAGLAEYQQSLSIQRHHGYEVMGVLVDSDKRLSRADSLPNVPVLGSLREWEEALASTDASVLIIAYPGGVNEDQWLGDVLRRCKELRVDVELYSCVLATANMNYEHDEFSGCSRFYAKPPWSLALQRALKRAMDMVIGLIGSVVTLLLIPVIWLLVNLEERGPLFYRSAYVGQDGSTCYYLKFRTMHVNADKILETNAELSARFREQQKLVDDPRVTKIGRILRKFSLDEFPQFFSVLLGDLTFVGPRTIRQSEAPRYGIQLEKLLSVKPGVTGFWQVMGRQTTTYSERVQMDMFYIDRWSIWLDLVIIAKTFWKVAKAEGAY